MLLRQLTPTSVYVGGIKYNIRPFPAFKAANISGELANMLLPFFGAVVGLIPDDNGNKEDSKDDGSESNTDISLSNIDLSEAAEALSRASNIDGGSVELMMRKLLLGGHISVHDIPDDSGNVVGSQLLTEDLANEIFCGELQNMYTLCYHVIRINFNGFFKKLVARSGKATSVETTIHTIS